MPGARGRVGGGRARRQSGRARARAWRAGVGARGRRIRPALDQALPRLLRRLLDGAPADRAGLDRADPKIQGDRLRPIRALEGARNMSAEYLGSAILWLIVVAIVVVIAVYLLRWLYRRSTKET